VPVSLAARSVAKKYIVFHTSEKTIDYLRRFFLLTIIVDSHVQNISGIE